MMTISDELAAKILRYHHAEKWRVGTIANQLLHHSWDLLWKHSPSIRL